MTAPSLVMALVLAAPSNPQATPGFAGGALILECAVSTRYEGYPRSFATPDETIRLRIGLGDRSLAYWDAEAAAYAAPPEVAAADWSRAFVFEGPQSATEIAADGSRYHSVVDSPGGRAETTGPCRRAN